MVASRSSRPACRRHLPARQAALGHPETLSATGVGDGEKIWIYDPELQQVTVRKAGQAISGSPAALLAGSNELEKNFTLKEAGEADGMAWVEATPKADDSGFEKVRLGFAGKDLKAPWNCSTASARRR
jgi:outer membrane lipoprotein-sorting protein